MNYQTSFEFDDINEQVTGNTLAEISQYLFLFGEIGDLEQSDLPLGKSKIRFEVDD